MKKISFEAKGTILSALDKYYSVIAPTYGPAGRSVLLDEGYQVKAVDDGKMASQDFELEDENEMSVIKYVRQAASLTDDRVGDGTTTAVVLTVALVRLLLEHGDLELPKDIPTEVVNLKKACVEAIAKIKKESKKVKTKEELFDIAKNSFNDDEVAKLISEAIFDIGKDGFLSVEDSHSTTTEWERVAGLQVEKGFVSPYLITSENGTCEIHNPKILVINKKIDTFEEISPILTQIVQTGKREVAIIADGFSEDVLKTFIVNKLKDLIHPVLIETPGFGVQKIEYLKDIAAVVGAKVIDPKKGDDLSQPNSAWLGEAEVVRASRDETTFVNGKSNKRDVEMRVKEVELELKAVQNGLDKERYQKRLAQLQGGIGVIRVGASTEQEQKTKRAKVEDAVNATRAAFRGGLSIGGGKTFDSLATSSEVLNQALKQPRALLEENGKTFLDDNVLDPTEVLVASLETAVSTACGLSMASGIISPKTEKKNE